MNKKVLTVCVILLLSVGIAGILLAGFFEKQSYPLKYSEYVDKYCAEYGVPRSLVYAVIRTESRFDPEAVSRVGAKGLMQLMPDTYSWLSRLMECDEEPEKITDPETNIKYGVYYLGHLYKRFGSASWETALAAYNAGHGRIGQWLQDSRYSDDGKTLKEIPIAETRNYLKTVFDAKEKYEKIYGKELDLG